MQGPPQEEVTVKFGREDIVIEVSSRIQMVSEPSVQEQQGLIVTIHFFPVRNITFPVGAP